MAWEAKSPAAGEPWVAASVPVQLTAPAPASVFTGDCRIVSLSDDISSYVVTADNASAQ